MKYLTCIGNAILDTCFAWFTPAWRRKGHDALSSLTRYINHFGPKLKPESLETLRGLQCKLRSGLRAWDKEATVQATGELENIGEGLPEYKRNPVAEMVESFFVIMVVFMGIRTYYTQPFRIPTGSMQPSLNGIIIHPIDEAPSFATRCWDALTLGSSYVDETADTEKAITGLQQSTKWLIFTKTTIFFDDGSKLDVSCAQGAVLQYLRDRGKVVESPMLGLQFLPFKAGETIMKARVDAGDMVFVNRMAYHFRKPERGETFVFDTRGIKTREDDVLAEQSGGTHYIKRLCGLPGDTLEIKDPELIINGRPAQEATIQRVIQGKAPYNKEGYVALNGTLHPNALLPAGKSVTLKNPENANLREYAALGDNTTNSLDSRYWGPVRQFNVLGPASFTLWPFTSHWGKID